MWPLSPPWDPPNGNQFIIADLRVRIVDGPGSEIVFLPGLGASLRYWGKAYDAFAPTHRLMFIDLLGFGGSAKPDGPYDRKAHVAALVDAFNKWDIVDEERRHYLQREVERELVKVPWAPRINIDRKSVV